MIACLPHIASAAGIVVVKSKNNAPTVRMVMAIRLAAKEQVTAELLVDDLGKLDGLAPDAIIALGPAAASALKGSAKPVVVAGVPNPEELGLSNVALVSMNAPAVKLAKLLRALLVGHARVGIIHRRAFEPSYIEQVTQALWKSGLEPVFAQASAEQEIMAALRSLVGRVDAFWLLPDSALLSGASTQFILKTANEYRLPVLVFTPELFRTGGLVSLSPDWANAGRLAADQATAFLAGKPPSGTVWPRFMLDLNTSLAESHGKPIAASLIEANQREY